MFYALCNLIKLSEPEENMGKFSSIVLKSRSFGLDLAIGQFIMDSAFNLDPPDPVHWLAGGFYFGCLRANWEMHRN